MNTAFRVVLLLLLTVTAFAQDTGTTPRKKRRNQAQQNQDSSTAPKPKEDPDRTGAVPGEPDSDGCGLGWQVTDKKTIIGSITRSTTAITIPPSFGMTSGTMGCRKTPFSKRDQAGVTYAQSNFDSLRIEMAEGRGETLDGFARMLGCSDTAAFGRMTQSRYSRIVGPAAGQQATPAELYRAVRSEIGSDPALLATCGA